MANDNLGTAIAPAKADDVCELASNIQDQAQRISSLATALDEAIDWSTADEEICNRLSRAYDYLSLIKECAGKAKIDAQIVEIHAMNAKNAAAVQ
jgi:hypothetical protein